MQSAYHGAATGPRPACGAVDFERRVPVRWGAASPIRHIGHWGVFFLRQGLVWSGATWHRLPKALKSHSAAFDPLNPPRA